MVIESLKSIYDPIQNKRKAEEIHEDNHLLSWKDSAPVIRFSEYLKANKDQGIHLILSEGHPALCFEPGLTKIRTDEDKQQLKYLRPQIHAGHREYKRFEKAFNRARILPMGMYIVPGSGAGLDQYGNMGRGLIVKILSYFKAFGEQGCTANITEKKKGKLPPGIYSRTSFVWGGAIKPIMIFVKKPSYENRYEFYKISKEEANRVWRSIFDDELNYALHQCQ